MHALGIGRTDVGKRREQNEDCFFIDNDLGLYIVSDGMGGHARGEVASQTAVETAAKMIDSRRAVVDRARRGDEPVAAVAKLVVEAVQEACRAVHRAATSSDDCAGMGCTLTLMVMAGTKAVMGHVGDSRLYLVRGDNVAPLSNDHTMVADLLRVGAIKPEQAADHPYANVLTRAIGSQSSVQVETLVFDVLPGDRMLLCSDGLSNYLENPGDLTERMGDDIDTAVDALVDFANEAGGHDNITALLVVVEGGEDERDADAALDAEVQRKLEALCSVYLFEDLTLPQLIIMLNACRIKEVAAGETLVTPGTPGDGLFIVLSGRLALRAEGRAAAELGPGDAVGQLTLVERRVARAAVETTAPTRLLVLSRARFRSLVRRRPWLGITLLERVSHAACAALDRARGEGDASALDDLF